MRVLILGGTGRTGERIAQAALEAGHGVTVVGRSARPDTVAPGAHALAADVLEPGLLDQAVVGIDAVVTALSIPRRSRSPFAAVTGPPDLHSRSTRALLVAMKAHGVTRLIKLSAQGVGDSAARSGLAFRALVAGSNLRHAFRDHAVADALVQSSDIDWTVVRPPALDDGPPTRTGLEAGEQLATGSWTRVRTADVAAWVVAALEDSRWSRRTLTLRPRPI